MGQIGDFYELCVVQRLFEQEVCNVFHYQLLRTGPGPANLVTAFNTFVRPSIQATQVDNLEYEEYRAFNINQAQTEFSTIPTSGTGDTAGDGMPPFVSYAYQLVRSSKEVRNGAKRIAGVDETWVTDGVLDPSKQTAVDTAAAVMGITLQVDGLNTFLPVVLRYSGTLATGYTVDASSAVANVIFKRISTQNSRKISE